MEKRPTIKDVAERANVSKTTVSHVLNNTRFVQETTRKRVLQAIADLRYRPSTAARSLTTTRTGKIGVLISDVSNYFFSELLLGVEDILRPLNYGILVCNTDEVLERESHYLELFFGQQVEGVIAAAVSQKWAVLTQAEAQRTPAVFVDRTFPGLKGPFVGVQDKEGTRLGVCHLIECGYTEIGILAGFQRLSTMDDRLIAFREVLQEKEISIPEEWVVTSPLTIEDGKKVALQILSLPKRPKALFISNNLLCLGCLLVMKELGLRCPEDIALVCFDDHPWAAVADPPLTVVRQPSRELGQVAAQMLRRLINGEELEQQDVRIPCELVVRQSSFFVN